MELVVALDGRVQCMQDRCARERGSEREQMRQRRARAGGAARCTRGGAPGSCGGAALGGTREGACEQQGDDGDAAARGGSKVEALGKGGR
eukprot:5502949-Pleurochrysis_carterae.AAC.3